MGSLFLLNVQKENGMRLFPTNKTQFLKYSLGTSWRERPIAVVYGVSTEQVGGYGELAEQTADT